MKYSLRSLMIGITLVVVTLVCIVSGFVARSQYCTDRAAFHRSQLQFKLKWKEDVRANLRAHPSPEGMAQFARIEAQLWFHEEAVIAYERASGMPWLPVNIPTEVL